jgi:hypothetical protein
MVLTLKRNSILESLAIFSILAIAFAGCSNPIAAAAKSLQVEAASPRLVLCDPSSNTIDLNGTLLFPSTALGSGTDLLMTIKNSGANTLVIDLAGISVTRGTNTDDGNFSVKTPPPASILAGKSATFELRFSPSSGGIKAATVVIPTNDLVNPRFSFKAGGTATGITLSTSSPVSITETTASAGGVISDDGGSSITARGICWSLSPSPTTSDFKQADGGIGTGSYADLLTGLTPGTLYYVRAYAINGTSTGYGTQASFTTLPTAPAMPTVLTVGFPAGSGQLSVSWTAVNGASIYYDIYYSSTITKPGSPNGPSSLAATSCILSGLNNYSSYYVWIVAKNVTGQGSPSPTIVPVMVGIKVASIALTKTSAKFLPGSSETITATCTPSNATQPSVVWSSSNIAAATVSAGVVTATAATGTFGNIITATAADGQGASAQFTPTTLVYSQGGIGPAGGMLILDNGSGSYGANGWRYLEAGAAIVGSGDPWTSGDANLTIPGATGTAFGTGKADTAAIIAAVGPGSYMAMDCRNYSLGGYSDWFMPSQIEANQLLYVNQLLLGSASIIGTKSYFLSSSQDSSYGYGCLAYKCTAPSWTTIQEYVSGAGIVTMPVRRF